MFGGLHSAHWGPLLRVISFCPGSFSGQMLEQLQCALVEPWIAQGSNLAACNGVISEAGDCCSYCVSLYWIFMGLGLRPE